MNATTGEDAVPEQPSAAEGAASDEVVAEGEVVDTAPSDADPAADAAEEVEAVAEQVEVALEDVLTTAESERDEFRDHLLRLQADFDNYRKRVHKELGKRLYEQAAGAAGDPGGATGGANDDEVVDAEIVDDDPKA